jgi:quercetin dioxygenase-like cupin family protein
MQARTFPYAVSSKDVPAADMAPPPGMQTGHGGALRAQMVFGTDTSIMIADRETGYHSKPHYHDAEQMNYVVAGSIWFFIEDQGYKAVQGDIVRIPRNATHWAWVRDPGGCTLFETHTPPLTGDAKMRAAAVSLLAPGESADAVRGVSNLWSSLDAETMAAVEARAIAAGGG